jgi:hypothetical protein
MSDLPACGKQVTKEQMAIILEVKKQCDSWQLGDIEKEHIKSDPYIYYRYSYGYGFDLNQSVTMLKKMLAWRAKYKPTSLRVKDLQWATKMFVFHHGFDKKGHPLVYMLAKNDNIPNTPENKVEKFKHVVHAYERAIKTLKGKDFQITLVVDFKDASLTIDMIKSTKGLFDELGEYYAERIHQIFVLNPPWTFGVCWGFLKPLLPPHVVQKYAVLNSSGKELRKDISQYIDPDQLAFYGTNDLKFDLETQIKLETTLFE